MVGGWSYFWPVCKQTNHHKIDYHESKLRWLGWSDCKSTRLGWGGRGRLQGFSERRGRAYIGFSRGVLAQASPAGASACITCPGGSYSPTRMGASARPQACSLAKSLSFNYWWQDEEERKHVRRLTWSYSRGLVGGGKVGESGWRMVEVFLVSCVRTHTCVRACVRACVRVCMRALSTMLS